MDAMWDVLTGAAVLGWFTTALFGAVAGAAVAIWARVNVLVGLLVGFLFVFGGLAVLVVIGSVRAVTRRRQGALPRPTIAGVSVPRPARNATASPVTAGEGYVALPAAPAGAAPVWSFAPDAIPVTGAATWGPAPARGARPGPVVRTSSGWSVAPGSTSAATDDTGWGSTGDPFGATPRARDSWPVPAGSDLIPPGTSLPAPAQRRATVVALARVLERVAGRVCRPTWPAGVVAALALGVGVGFAVTSQLTWVSVQGLDGREIFSVGPFGLQLGVFVVGSAIAAGVSGVGVLLWRSAWWPVLCAWCASWWIFVAVEALSMSNSVSALNRFVQSSISSRTGYEESASLLFGDGWSWVLVAALVLLATSVGLLVLQHRGTERRVA